MDDEALEQARQRIREDAESTTPPVYDREKERAELLKRLDVDQALANGSRETFAEFAVAMMDAFDPENPPGYSDEDWEAFRGRLQMWQDIERSTQPQIDRAHRRLEALNQEDLARATLSASQGVARATWVLSGATIVLALATLALIWATLSA